MEQRIGVPWEEVKAELLKDPETAQALKDLEPEYEIIREIIEARIQQGLTQEEGPHSGMSCVALSKTVPIADGMPEGVPSGLGKFLK